MMFFRPLFPSAAVLQASCSPTDYITAGAFAVLHHNGGHAISREQGLLMHP